MMVEQERDEGMVQFINQYADTPLKFEMLRSWGRHPEATFNLTTIVNLLHRPLRADVEKTLVFFEKAGLIERESHHGVNLYKLTTDPEKRGYVTKLPAYWQIHYRES